MSEFLFGGLRRLLNEMYVLTPRDQAKLIQEDFSYLRNKLTELVAQQKASA